jgi:hypothetical protein
MMRADFNRCEKVASILLVSYFFYWFTNVEINIEMVNLRVAILTLFTDSLVAGLLLNLTINLLKFRIYIFIQSISYKLSSRPVNTSCRAGQ